jgi:geranylgeranyl pyrophosphate synthase
VRDDPVTNAGDASADLCATARRALLDWPFREALLAAPAEDNARGSWLRYLREMSAGEVSRELWATAMRGRPSSWKRLDQFLHEHLAGIQTVMFETIDRLGVESRYGDILKGVIRTWPGSVKKTPSSVVWILAMMHATRGRTTADIYPIAAASAFYYQGVVILDDVADGELEPIASSWPRGQAEHIAYSMAGALPLAAIEAAVMSDQTRARIVSDFSRAIWITNIGQFLDLEILGPVLLSEERAVEIARYKTGLGIAKLTRLGGHYLGLPNDQIDAWERATASFATARQIASDVCDIWHKPVSPDLITGKSTLPIVLARRNLTEGEQPAFDELRARCRYEQRLHGEMRATLERLGALGEVQARIERWRAAGTAALDEIGVDGAAREWILTWASQADVFGDIC